MILYDLLGACTSLLSTYYFIRLDTKAWPISLISTCINSWLYWQKGIYAEMFLESFYFLSICYGWYCWSSKQHIKLASLKHLTNRQLVYLSGAIFALYFIIFNVLTSYTHSTVPKLDALTTSLSIAAQCLMCYKVIASWVLWFIADALYALMYSHKDLPFHTFIMLPYLVFAVYGCIKWHKKYKLGSTNTPLTYNELLTDPTKTVYTTSFQPIPSSQPMDAPMA